MKNTLLVVLIGIASTLAGCDQKAESVVAAPQEQEAAPAPAAEARILVPVDRPMPKPRRSEPTSY